MHTALQLSADDFRIKIDGAPSDLASLLPGWTPHDRFGIVVHEPYGAIGASYLIQAAIVAFYDVRPQRRAGRGPGIVEPNDVAIYPDIYIFHVGGRHGDFSMFDFWPARKEVFVESDPRLVLDAVNDRGITRLAVPDVPPRPVEHEYKEPAAARDRIESVFAYSASGQVDLPDITIHGVRPAAEVSPSDVLDPKRMCADVSAPDFVRLTTTDPVLLQREWARLVQLRADEGSEGLELARARRSALDDGQVLRETYRRISVDDALNRLVPSVQEGPGAD
ncbi:hypothetical protein M1247_13910 [Mycobacterium sp. 21AC1]|uniref:hypothetical protein n=1 Tax=[Mycobacterium] appelbergii TaxID=2939269 RepID=UPI002938EF8E|nr:hypothetical protein [Mycobacterium sp. 21AC1]MDV3126018.1 hypothetical protein [Mycobacterium sp. 21AC1]